MKSDTYKIRNSNIELLRIICMILIVVAHFCQGVLKEIGGVIQFTT